MEYRHFAAPYDAGAQLTCLLIAVMLRELITGMETLTLMFLLLWALWVPEEQGQSVIPVPLLPLPRP